MLGIGRVVSRLTRGRARYVFEIFAKIGGSVPRECNLCGYRGNFRAIGHPPRYDARCPACSSLERHRLTGLYFQRNPKHIDEQTRVLHFAPEEALRTFFRATTQRYQSADFAANRADLKLDIEQIDLADGSMDLIICSHVLEHVDDAKALAEMRRILSPNGTVVILVPIIEGWASTYENAAATLESDRALHFGQSDHVRMCGSDFRKRVANADLHLSEFTAVEPDVLRYGLLRGEKVFFATKAAQLAPAEG